VGIEEVSLRFFDRPPAVLAKVEIESDLLFHGQPAALLRGQILEIGGFAVERDLRIRSGKHTMLFANDEYLYRFEMMQPGSSWFRAELTLKPAGLVAKIRKVLRF
jgi:hypothetical protein